MKLDSLAIAATLGVALFAITVSAPTAAHAAKVSAETVAAIKKTLADAGMKCEIDADNIERSGKGYELEDVFCTDGQYDMKLSADYKIVSKKKE